MSDAKGRGFRIAFTTAMTAALVFSAADPADAARRKKRVHYKPQPERLAIIAIDADTNEVLTSKFADEKRHPASLTKVMTLYMLFDQVDAGKLKLTDRIPISLNASRQAPTKLGAPAGSTISVEEAINALVIQSANDVATAVAEKIGGTESKFATMMTSRGREIGLEKTVFVNASGLPDVRQITSARDIATLSQAIMTDHPGMYKYFSATEMVYGPAHFRNHNKLLGRIEGVDGIKTGYTRMSGFNLSTSAVRDGHRVIAVVLGGQTARSRDTKMQTVLEEAFADLENRQNAKTQVASASGQPRIAFSALPMTVQPRPVVNAPSIGTALTASPFGVAASGGSASRADGLTLDGLRGNVDVVPDLY
ncbi:MAG: D-alanyl-D-alanine carboxypeptidase family protein [Caulobacterales bacterium]